jgi:hypothetical protein
MAFAPFNLKTPDWRSSASLWAVTPASIADPSWAAASFASETCVGSICLQIGLACGYRVTASIHRDNGKNAREFLR